MKNVLTNLTENPISLFAKVDDIEQKIEIAAGESVLVDDYETKTMRVFNKRGFTKMEPLTVNQKTGEINVKYNPILVAEDIYLVTRADSAATIDSTMDSNNDEPMDHFHTTEDHEVVVTGDLDRLDVVAGEVEQYVEGGYIKGEWTDEDIAFLKKYYPTKGRKYCSTQLNRNESSVQKKINALSLKKKKKKK